MSILQHTIVDQVHLLQNTNRAVVAFITLGKNYIHYSICDADKSRLYSSKTLFKSTGIVAREEFDTLLSDSLLRRSTMVNIAIDTGRQTLVPTALLALNKHEIYFVHQHEIEADDEIMSQAINTEITELYLVKKASLRYFKNSLPNIRLFSHSACLLSQYLHELKSRPYPETVFLHTTTDGFQLSYFQERALRFSQSFELLGPNDILYSLLNIPYLQKVDRQQLWVMLTGFAQQQQDIASLLSDYFKVITYEPQIAEGPLEGLPLHILYHQYSLITCAS